MRVNTAPGSEDDSFNFHDICNNTFLGAEEVVRDLYKLRQEKGVEIILIGTDELEQKGGEVGR